MGRVALIIAAAGCGARFSRGAAADKLWMELDGEPLFLSSLRRLCPAVTPGRLVLAANPERIGDFEDAVRRAGLPAPVRIVPGGTTRIESVSHALDALEGEDGLVGIHDAARPLADGELLLRLCAEAERFSPAGVVPAARISDTVKKIDPSGAVVGDVNRDEIAAVGTPQVFPLAELRRAVALMRESGRAGYTDDAGIYRAAGFPVRVLFWEKANFKVTWPEDLERVRLFSTSRRV